MGAKNPDEARARARAGTAPRVPSALDILGELEEVRELSLNARRSWIDRHTGEEQSYPQPDYRAAISAIRVKAEVCGYIRDGVQWDTDLAVTEAVRRALSDPELRRMVLAEIRKLEPALLTEGEPVK